MTEGLWSLPDDPFDWKQWKLGDWLYDENGKPYPPDTLFQLANDDLADSEHHGERGRYRIAHLQELFRKGEISLLDIGWKL